MTSESSGKLTARFQATESLLSACYQVTVRCAWSVGDKAGALQIVRRIGSSTGDLVRRHVGRGVTAARWDFDFVRKYLNMITRAWRTRSRMGRIYCVLLNVEVEEKSFVQISYLWSGALLRRVINALQLTISNDNLISQLKTPQPCSDKDNI